MARITERILLAADANGGLAAITTSGSQVEWDASEGLSECCLTWKDVLPKPPAPGLWVFKGWVHHTRDEGPEYHGSYRPAAEAEVLASMKGEMVWLDLEEGV